MQIYYITIWLACYLFRLSIVATFREVFFEGTIT